MLAKWTRVLPFFVVEWIAKRYCESFYDNKNDNKEFKAPYNGVRFDV